MGGATTSRSHASRETTTHFKPRPSCEGRPGLVVTLGELALISIHAPHARGDRARTAGPASVRDFNPRPSCEGRQKIARSADLAQSFQSTPLMRGATAVAPPYYFLGLYFNPRPSCEGRRVERVLVCLIQPTFQSTPLMRGATTRSTNRSSAAHDFNPRPSCEGRHSRQ